MDLELKPTGPPPLTYESRLHAFEKTRRFELTADALAVHEEEGASFSIPFSGVVEARLKFAPSRVQRNRYQCQLKMIDGRVWTVGNTHYRGIADFEDRSDQYRRWIPELLRAIDRHSPQCVFVTGTSALAWWANLVFLVGVFALLIAVMFMVAFSMPVIAIIKLAIIAFFVPTAIRWFIKNKPKRFDALSIPADCLP